MFGHKPKTHEDESATVIKSDGRTDEMRVCVRLDIETKVQSSAFLFAFDSSIELSKMEIESARFEVREANR